ncbi:MAG: cupredoxin domain-containing protein [Nitrososphaerota archaeon]
MRIQSYSSPNPFLLIGLLLIAIFIASFAVLAVVLPISFPLATVKPNNSTNSTIIPVHVSIVLGAASNESNPGYSPDVITVVIGINNTVIWTNNDNFAHTVTSVSKVFDSGNMNPGATFSYTFTTPGVYNYTCTYHPWMHGTVIVKSGLQGVTVIIPLGAYNPPPNWNNSHIISNNYYSPSIITVVIGVNNTVTWVNHDTQQHTVTSVNGIFDSGLFAPGQTFTYTFTKPGTYEYYCTVHPWMGGEVIVLSGNQTQG